MGGAKYAAGSRPSCLSYNFKGGSKLWQQRTAIFTTAVHLSENSRLPIWQLQSTNLTTVVYQFDNRGLSTRQLRATSSSASSTNKHLFSSKHSGQHREVTPLKVNLFRFILVETLQTVVQTNTRIRCTHTITRFKKVWIKSFTHSILVSMESSIA